MNRTFSDRVLRCKDCKGEYVFGIAEQEAFASRGLENAPSRCPECRAARKGRQAEAGQNGRGHHSGFGNGPAARRPAREMHPITCSSCGRPAEVPFVPRGDRPVYCSECYNQVRASR